MNKERTRTYSWEDPMIGAGKGMQMSGFDYLTAINNGELPLPPVLKTVGVAVGKIEPGIVTFEFIPEEFHYNPLGSVHGGMITTVLDSAMGCSLHSTLAKGIGYTTLELKVNFLRPITIKTGRLSCIGKVINVGSKTALTEAQIIDDSGKIYAHAVSTCMILATN